MIKLEEKLCEKLVEGARLSDVYESTVAMVKSEHPDLVDKLTKNFGFVMGIEFREPSLSIAPNCTATVKKGMVFNLNVGFSGLTNSQVGHTDTLQLLPCKRRVRIIQFFRPPTLRGRLCPYLSETQCW